MAMLNSTIKSRSRAEGAPELSSRAWKGRVAAAFDHDRQSCRIQCGCVDLVDMCQWLGEDLGFVFATLIVDESAGRMVPFVHFLQRCRRAVGLCRCRARRERRRGAIDQRTSLRTFFRLARARG